ncbi:MAG: glycosyltransferase family 2 protein [Alphaproteobacteria bacterium]
MTVVAIMPVRDGAAYLAEALDSIAAQTRPPDEVLVVDDGSADDGPAIAAGHPLRPRVVRQPARGTAAARNRGVRESRADLIAFLDADDLWLPQHLAVLSSALAAAPEAAIAFGHIEQFASPELGADAAARMIVPTGAQPGFSTQAMLARRTVFETVGPFDEGIRAGYFIDWFMRGQERGLRHFLVPEVVARRRHHAGNIGRIRPDYRADYLRVVRAALQRRRTGAVS